MTAHSPVGAMSAGSLSPRSTMELPTKNVSFVLLFPESPQFRARLPLRVRICSHDTTDSIVSTVKNFYGLYSGPTFSKGVSFEDQDNNTLIARYENFHDNMTVFVRVIEQPIEQANDGHEYQPLPVNSNGFGSHDSYQHYAPVSRPVSRTSRVRSPSPNSGRGRRSDSAGTGTSGKKGRSRDSKARGDHTESLNGYSSGDGAPGSASGKARDLGNTDISVENIVEGGRRKRPKFESSILPLFAPPQMPAAASNSSVSPARRADHHRHSLPAVQTGPNPFSNPRPLQSPQSYNNGYANTYATPGHDERRARGSFSYGGAVGPGMGIMPTPDPTVRSSMSEEDAAAQLMRLGEMSNVSHGRTSASTLDETFSGNADAASSTGATSDAESEDDEPPARRQKLDSAGNHKKSFQTTQSHFVVPNERDEASGDDADYEDGAEEGSMAAPKLKNPKSKFSSTQRPRSQSSNKSKSTSAKQSKPKTKKAPTVAAGQITPASLPASRKQSVAPNPPPPAFPLAPAEDETPDLSTKPRCQRCRKSKKGCDRQRPCGRCRDAGLSAEMCISEDEGNGRKGRYGRHMGVPLKKDTDPAVSTNLLPAAPIATSAPGAGAIAGAVSSGGEMDQALGGDKNKKRKR